MHNEQHKTRTVRDYMDELERDQELADYTNRRIAYMLTVYNRFLDVLPPGSFSTASALTAAYFSGDDE